MLSIGALGTNFSEILIIIQNFSFMKMHLKISPAKWRSCCPGGDELIHWGWVTHICVGNLTIIGSDNGLSSVGRQAIIWTNAGILLIGPLGTKFSQILIAIHTFSFKKMHLKLSSAKCLPFCLGLNVLKTTASQGTLTWRWFIYILYVQNRDVQISCSWLLLSVSVTCYWTISVV